MSELDKAFFRTPKEPTEKQKAQFRGVFGPGDFYLLVGPRGKGKTSFGVQVIDAAVMHGWYPEYEVATNILFKRKIRLPDGSETFEECYPHGIHKVTSMSDVFHLIPDVLERGHILLLVIDEALQSEGFASGQSVLSADVRAVRSFASIIRKVNICVILIAQSWRMVASSYRNADFITGIIRRRFDSQIVPGYGAREVVEFIGPRGYEMKENKLLVDTRYAMVLKTTAPTGLAKPIEIAREGDVVFDTKAPAQFGMGLYKVNGKKFQLFAAIGAMSDVIEEKTVAALRHHLSNPPGPKAQREGEEGMGDEEEMETDEGEGEQVRQRRWLTPDEKEEVIAAAEFEQNKRRLGKQFGISEGAAAHYIKIARQRAGIE